MARLLRDSDYNRIIKAENLEQIISEANSLKLEMEQVAQQEMISKLSQRYDVAKVFTNTSVWDVTRQYQAKNLIEYTEPEFDQTEQYIGHAQYNNATSYNNPNRVIYLGYIYEAIGATTGNLPTNATFWTLIGRAPRVSYKGKIYEAITTTQGNLPTDTTSWRYICDDLSLFYVTLPYSEWSVTETYAPGDTRFFNNSVYTAVAGNKGLRPDENSGVWGVGTPFITTAGIVPDDISVWTAGDNRNPLIVTYLLDMTTYHLLSRMPRNFSDIRKERYDGNSPQQTGGAIGWLKRVSKGEDNADLPEKLEPSPQYRIMSGSARPKQSNFFW